MKKQKGSGLIFAVILLFVILGMVVTLSSITVLETKMSQKTKSSVGAFYNSESGVEWALNKIATSTVTTITGTFGEANVYDGVACPEVIGGATVCTIYLLKGDGSTIANTDDDDISLVKAVRSVGSQNTGEVTQRAIEAAVAAEDEEYQISCAGCHSGNSSCNYACCRIKIETGLTDCKFQGGSGAGSWFPWGQPFVASPTAGKWRISCYMNTGGSPDTTSANLDCCRYDAVSGDAECKVSTGSDSPWVKYTVQPWP